MSKTVDAQRALDAEDERNLRLERLLLELLTVVRARAKGQPGRVVAEQINRSRRTVLYRQQILEELLEQLKRKGLRRTE